MRLFIAAAVLLSFAPASARAQGPLGADTLNAGAIADSQKVLIAIDKQIEANPKDAEAWNHRGMVAWLLAIRSKGPNPPRGLDPTTLGRMADTSLRIAAQLAPNNVYYRLAVGRFLLASGFAVTRFSAPGFFNAALDVARKGRDSVALAEAAIESGRVRWRRYDALANRRMETRPGAAVRSISQALQPVSNSPDADAMSTPQNSMKFVRDAIENGSQPLPKDVTGASDLAKATELFREAYAASPATARTFRSVGMVLAEKESWNELEVFARQHLATIPWDPYAWMALGLAMQRQNKSKVAATAFDSAMAYLAPAERARLDRLERVLPASDSARRANGAAPPSAAIGNLYWMLADPLWSRDGNESRIEFLARVTYAELRWTVDELKVRGADTDRGDIFVRYGPPDLVAVFGPPVGSSSYNAIEEMNVSTVWAYPTGLIFVFNGAPTFATAHTANSDVAMVGAIKEALPVRWDNLATMRVDSMATQIARFRGGRDSVDLFVAMDPPVDSIRAATAAGAPIRGDVWLLAGNMSVSFRDSMALAEPGVRSLTRRVKPDLYIVRGEASSDGSLRGGRATAVVDARDNGTTGVAQKGFGISDLLLSSSAEPRAGVEKRWTDLDITPSVGALRQNGQLALVWENYEFGQRDGSARYQVAITLKRERSLPGQIAAGLFGTLASAARLDRGADHAGATFDRTLPFAAAFVDHITLSLGETPAGTYTLTLQVTDQVTGKVVTRTKSIRIRA